MKSVWPHPHPTGPTETLFDVHNCWMFMHKYSINFFRIYKVTYMAATVWNKLISVCCQVSFNIKLAKNALKLQNPNTSKLKTKWDKESQLSKDILAFPELEAVTARRCYVVCQCSAQCSVSVWRRKVESRDVPKPAVSCGQGSRRPVSRRGSFGNRSLGK